MEISPRVRILATIKPGTIYYFTEESFNSREPHFFVVLNNIPHKDETLILACAQSEIEKRKRARRLLPCETLVEVSPTEFPLFTCDTIFDCNSPISRSAELIVNKLESGSLKTFGDSMPDDILKKLIKGVLASPLVDKETKNFLSAE